MIPRIYRRAVMARRDSQEEARRIAEELATANPTGEYAVEYTPVAIQLEQWRVIHITPVPEGTPDRHPRCEELRRNCLGQIRDTYQQSDW